MINIEELTLSILTKTTVITLFILKPLVFRNFFVPL